MKEPSPEGESLPPLAASTVICASPTPACGGIVPEGQRNRAYDKLPFAAGEGGLAVARPNRRRARHGSDVARPPRRRRADAASYGAIAVTKDFHPRTLALSDPGALAPWVERGFFLSVDETRLAFDRRALDAYEIKPGECVPPIAACWLFSARAELEHDGEVAKAAWCVSCGAGCTDGRGHVARIRQWCARCVRLRHRPEYRRCEAADCPAIFWSERANHRYCSAACTEAEGRWDRALMAASRKSSASLKAER